MPRLSIVTPVLNGARFLPEMLASVAGQNADFEHIIVDGGSADGTLDLLRDYCACHRWARCVSGRDSGQSEAINRGAALASGEFIAWLNADDLYLPGALDQVTTAILRYPNAGLFYGGARIITAGGAPVYAAHAEPFHRPTLLRRRNFIPQPAAFIRADLFRQLGGLDQSLHYTMDYDLWLRISRLAPAVAIDAPLAAFRLHGASKTCSRQWRFHFEQAAVALRHGASLASPIVWNAVRYVAKEPARRFARSLGWLDELAPYRPRTS